jgi:hypothetical protein
MKPRSATCLGLLHLALIAAGFSQSAPKLEQVLPRIQEHVQEFEHSLPDFICNEKITSRELMGGTTIHETDIDSTFRGTQNRDKNPDGKYEPFTKWRDIQTIDGPRPKRPKASQKQAANCRWSGCVQLWCEKETRCRIFGDKLLANFSF